VAKTKPWSTSERKNVKPILPDERSVFDRKADAVTAADTATTSRRSTGTCNSANLYLKNKEEYNSSHLYLNLSPLPFFPNALYVGQLYHLGKLLVLQMLLFFKAALQPQAQ